MHYREVGITGRVRAWIVKVRNLYSDMKFSKISFKNKKIEKFIKNTRQSTVLIFSMYFLRTYMEQLNTRRRIKK